MFREVSQGDAGPGGGGKELFEGVVHLEGSGGGQLGEEGSGQWLGERADLDETVEVVAVADLRRVGTAEYAEGYLGHGGCLCFQLWGRGTAQAAVPPGIRCRFLATHR